MRVLCLLDGFDRDTKNFIKGIHLFLVFLPRRETLEMTSSAISPLASLYLRLLATPTRVGCDFLKSSYALTDTARFAWFCIQVCVRSCPDKSLKEPQIYMRSRPSG